jgi:hypothetical protein
MEVIQKLNPESKLARTMDAMVHSMERMGFFIIDQYENEVSWGLVMHAHKEGELVVLDLSIKKKTYAELGL